MRVAVIRFRRLTIKNFFSFRQRQIVPLAGQGVVRIEGVNKDEPGADSNMAGKSSLKEALVWCLFGRTIRGLKHDSVVNRFTRRNCCVSLSFSVSGVRYNVTRYRRHSKFHNGLYLHQGAKSLTRRHEAQTQQKLEHILGCDYQTFTNTAIFGGAKPFALLTDAEQKKVLESFLGFSKFEAALQGTRETLTRSREKLHGLELKAENLQGKTEALRSTVRTLRDAQRIQNRDRTAEAREIKRSIKKLVDPAPGPSRKTLENAEEGVEALERIVAKHQAEFYQLRTRIRTVRENISNRESLIGKKCPSCGRKVTADTVTGFLSHLEADRVAIKRDLAKSKRTVARWKRRLAYGRRDLKRLQTKSQVSHAKKDTNETLRRDLEVRLRSIRKSRTSPFSGKIERLQSKYSRCLSRLLVCQTSKAALEIRIEDLEFWEQGFGNQGVKALVVREALPTLNAKLREYAAEIFKGGVHLEFSPTKTTKAGAERELFHLRYQSRHGSGNYLGESDGGRRRVDICVLLVFSWLSRTCDLLLVDELLDGLDESGRESVLGILGRLRGTVFVISHERKVKAHLGRVWTVTKHNGTSILDTGE